MSVIEENTARPHIASGPDANALERETQTRGRALLAAVRREEKGGGPSDYFYTRLMALTTADERLKVELFRFVDALPALKTSEAVTRHLQEYLLRPDVKLPPGGASLLRFLGALAPTRGVAAAAARIGARTMARRFIAGADAREATAAVERLHRHNMTFTLDLLGEAVTSEADAVAYQNKYLALLRDLSDIARRWPDNPQTDAAPWGPLPKVNVSVKLPALYARFDPMAADATCGAVKERLRPILRLARERDAFVNFDMEQHDFCALTRRIFQEVFCEDEFRDWSDVGIVTQAYLRHSLDDLRTLHDWAASRGTPVWVRLVKGAYWDYETTVAAQRGHPVPVFQHKAETDANYERCAAFLIENGRTLRPAIASHNVRSVARAQALAAAHALPPRAVEYQVLFGMGEPIGRALSRQGERVRVYVPFGELLPGMAYLVRRLLENTSNDSFIRSAHEKGDAAGLLADPADVTLTPGPSPRPGRGEEVAEGATAARSRIAPGTPLPNLGEGPGVRAATESGVRAAAGAFYNEPETDFAVPAHQTAMRAALEAVRGRLGAEVPVVIGGVGERSPRVEERRDPSDTGRIVARVCYSTPEQAERAVAAAYGAFPGWRDTPVAERARLLRHVADEFDRRRFEIAAWQVYEVGKPWRDADADVAEAIDFCRFYADEMERLAQPRRRNVPGEWNEYFYEARGPAVIIAPWNFPLAILTGMATAALVAGNPVVLKPSEQSSRVGFFLMEALVAAGVPAGVANFLPGDGETVGPLLVNDPRVALIAFTGSREVGLSILKSAAEVRPGQREIKRVVAELGGKNAVIVDEDADLDEAVVGVTASAIGFSGQKCSACSRVVVVGSAYEQFCARLAEAVKSIRIGPADDPATTLGPVVDEAARDRILRYIQVGEAEGRLLARRDVPPELIGRGWYVPAAVFTDCPPDGRLCQEEVFGPVLAVLRARDLDEALRVADDSPYALTGGLYSRSPRNIERARREFRVGNLYINRKITGALVDRQPFGGARMSGVGSKAGGPDYLLQFLVPRTITESVMRRGFAPSEDMDDEGI
jgi:RHH-type proline utilization regulon transcriptional repressor/proline dehydrogenase/delta 1-pyrroline-5-carboxylate dehydrogenase